MKKQLYELKMDEGINIRNINKFNKCITQSVEDEIHEEEIDIILLVFILKSYETLLTTLLVGKMTLLTDMVLTIFLEIKNIKQSSQVVHLILNKLLW